MDSERPRSGAAVPDGTCVYAIGDVHGCAGLLDRLHGRILEHAAARAAGRKVVVYLGDYVDRGPDSRRIIETLIEQPLAGFEAVHLKGNHEAFLLDFLESGAQGPAWMHNGGVETVMSYGVDPGAAMTPANLERLRAAFGAALPPAHLAFLQGLELSHAEGGYLFVHAGIRPGRPLASQEATDLLWIRDDFLNSAADHGAVVVHGHSIQWQPDVQANRIGIDTGAFASGVLTCLVLEGAERDFIQTAGDGEGPL